jgi:hypothetical protein
MGTASESSPQTPRPAPQKAKDASVDRQRRPRPPRQPKPQGRLPKSEEDEAYSSRAEGSDFHPNGTSTADGSSGQVQKNKTRKPKSRMSSGPARPAAEVSPASAGIALPMNNPPKVPETPMKAYAGPTFHASPAPSSLPIPKFFSKSVPSGTAHPSLQSRLENEDNVSPQVEANSSTSNSSPAMEDAKPQAAATESPLDIFFKADKAEKSNRKSLGATPTSDQKKKSILHPPQAAPTHWASIYGVPPKHSRNASTGSAKDLFLMELDGSANHSSPERGRHLGPRTITAPPTVPYFAGDHTPPKTSASLYYDAAYGVSTPVLPSEMEGSPAARPASVSSAHASLHRSPRSAGSTPLPQAQHMQNPPLHYGNRVLSPLFHAAKAESTRRQSNLRMQVSPTSPTPGLEMPGSVPTPPQMGAPSNVAARQYLETQMGFHTPNSGGPLAHGPNSKAQSAPVTELDGNMQQPPAKSGLAQSLEANRRQQMPAILQSPTRAGPNPSKLSTPPTVKPSFSSPADLKTMENDLKRMLNLSNGRSGGR